MTLEKYLLIFHHTSGGSTVTVVSEPLRSHWHMSLFLCFCYIFMGLLTVMQCQNKVLSLSLSLQMAARSVTTE